MWQKYDFGSISRFCFSTDVNEILKSLTTTSNVKLPKWRLTLMEHTGEFREFSCKSESIRSENDRHKLYFLP